VLDNQVNLCISPYHIGTAPIQGLGSRRPTAATVSVPPLGRDRATNIRPVEGWRSTK